MSYKQKLAVLFLFIPCLSVAEKPKPVVVEGGFVETTPREGVVTPVKLEPGGSVQTEPLPARAATLKPVLLDQTTPSFIVPRDAILKFVNLAISEVYDTGGDGLVKCDATVVLRIEKMDPLVLGQIIMLDTETVSGIANHISGNQFLTGDILVPAGSVLSIETTSEICYAEMSTILFEQ
jgi:hypothetical protein